MIRALTTVLLVALAVPTHEQDTPISPCPNVFMYEPPGSEPGRWYGVVNLSTDSTLHSLWLNIVLDSKADILGNWVGDVTTQDNIDFKVENTQMKINPGPAVAVRFFVQYNQLNKAPRLETIRLNGREICNAKSLRPSIDGAADIAPNRPVTAATRPQYTPPPFNTKPIQEPFEEIRPVYEKPASNPIPSKIDGGEDTSLNVGNIINKRPNTRPNSRPTFGSDSVSNGRTTESPYFQGGQIVIKIPSSSSNTNTNNRPEQQDPEQCGKVVLNNPVPLVINGSPTLEGQWPWHIALYQTQTVDSKYICGGSLVSKLHVITAAHCVTLNKSKRPVNPNTLTVYLGKYNLRTSVEGVQIRFVENILVHPEYDAPSYRRDLAILKLREPISITDRVRLICFWPDNQVDLNNIIGKQGTVVGWGYDETDMATEELIRVDMPVVSQEKCLRSHSEFFVDHTSEYTYCAGFRNGTSVCNGDSGGGMFFMMGNTWYLRGLVSLSVARENANLCNPSHYIIFTDLAKLSPWIQQNVIDY